MDYNDTIQWLFKQLPMFSRTGAAAYKPGLDTSLALDSFFGHPHRRFRSIHVAGTNGKGSVSHNLASILMAQGYRTALYTSPHLVDFRERIRVDGEMIPREAVVDFVERYRNSGYEGHPSFFELTMMMAFDWFARCEVDYAVIEVGMGGRLDSTNIIDPVACVITNISKDHTQFLGNTLPEIAREKAGIIKKDVPVTVGEAEGDVREVFAAKALEVGAPIRFAQETPEVADEFDPADFRDLKGRRFGSPLTGDYQRRNLNTVLVAARMLRESAGVDLSDDSISKGVADVCRNTHLAGRWMIMSESPLVIADTGHNEAGLRYNLGQLHRLMEQRGKDARLRFVIGFVADKDIANILRLFPHDAEYYISNALIPRALPASDLAEKCRESGLRVEADHVFPTVGEAYSRAYSDASDEDIVYVGGSTFIVADFLSSFSTDSCHG